ncbi:hypothetical protein LTS10_006775 [Elasticomyces elasticus]|nr:hypothetical protein LTS10_006775 [Elasticomyces elasticus]
MVVGIDQDLVAYEAISYSWGEFMPCVPIIINGQEYRLSRSLASALQRFRLVREDRYLWADALCINQHNDNEKSAQVGNMFAIYYKAQRVLAWLGPEGGGTAEAITKVDQSSNMESDSHDMLALKDLCFRPWARRVWVQQEVFAAKELALFSGLSEMRLESYQSIARKYLFNQLRRSPPGWSVDTPTGIAINAIMKLHTAGSRGVAAIEAVRVPTPCEQRFGSLPLWQTSWEPMYGLANVLPRCKAFEASDPRDLIFALLGLTNCASGRPTGSEMVQDDLKRPLHFKIDYTMSVSEVFQQATKYILNSDRSLLLLSTSGVDNLPPSDPLLPSWTIDWRGFQETRRFKEGYVGHKGPTGDDVPSSSRLLQWQPSVNDGHLRLNGIILGSLHSVTVEHEKDDEVTYCHLEWKLFDAAGSERDGASRDTYISHHQGQYEPYRLAEVIELHYSGRIAVGDIAVRVDGCLPEETLCLRPVLDGKFRYVCMIPDGDQFRMMMKDGIHEGCGLCDGSFDELLVRRMVGDMASPPLEFVVC